MWGKFDRRTRHGSADDRLLRPRRHHHRPVMGVTRCVEGDPPRLHNFRCNRGRRHGPPDATGRGVRKWRRRQNGGDASAENALSPRRELTRGHRWLFLIAHEPGEDVWGKFDRRTCHGSADDRLLQPRRHHHRPVKGVTRCVEGDPPRRHNIRGSRGRRHGPPDATGRGMRKWRRRQNGAPGGAGGSREKIPRSRGPRDHRRAEDGEGRAVQIRSTGGQVQAARGWRRSGILGTKASVVSNSRAHDVGGGRSHPGHITRRRGRIAFPRRVNVQSTRTW